MINYAFTLRKTNKKNGVSKDDYVRHMDKIFKDNGCVVFDYEFEDDCGLHVHGCVSIPVLFEDNLFKLRVRGWRCHMVPIYDLSGWIAYYNKHIKRKLYVPYEPTQKDLDDFEAYAQSQKGDPTCDVNIICDNINAVEESEKTQEKEGESSEGRQNLCT